MSRTRSLAVAACIVLGALLAPLTAAATWLRVDVLAPHTFARHVDGLLADQRVQREITAQVLDQITASGSRASPADRAVLEHVTATVLATQPLRDLLRRAVARLHTQLVDGAPLLELDLRPPVDRVRTTLRDFDPRLASLLPSDDEISPIVIARRSDARQLWTSVTIARHVQYLVPLAAVGVIGLGAVLARRRTNELAIAGAAIAIACVLVLVALRVTRGHARSSIPDSTGRQAFDAVWATFAAPLVRNLRVGALVGLAVVVAIVVVRRVALSAARRRRPHASPAATQPPTR